MNSDPKIKPPRWIGLMLVACMTIGNSWIYNFPGILYSSLASSFGEPYDLSENEVLYSVYSWPNVFLALVSGLFIDQWFGLSKTTAVFASLVLIGQIIFSVGVTRSSYSTAVIGRFVYGLGGEGLKVAQNTWIVCYAEESSLSRMFGVVLLFSRASSALSFVVTPIIAETSLDWAVWSGTILTGLSTVAAFTLVSIGNVSPIIDQNVAFIARTSWKDRVLEWMDVLKNFSQETYLQFLICVFYHVGVLLMYQISSPTLQVTGFIVTESVAAVLVGLPSFISIMGIPIFGFIIDRYGNALWAIFSSCILLIVAHVFLILSIVSGGTDSLVLRVTSFIFIGVSYSMATATIWPLVPFLVPSSQLATAYGAMTSVEYLALAIMSTVLTAIQDSPGIQQKNNPWRYITPLIVLLSMTVIAAMTSCAQIRLDTMRHSGRLNKPAAHRRDSVDS